MQKSKPIFAVLRVAILLAAVCQLASGCKKAAPEKPKKTTFARGGMKLVELDLEIHAVTGPTTRDNIEDISPPHLRKYKKNEKRKPFMVIEGLENLAMFKPVTVSNAPGIGEIEQINDGIMSSDEFDFVEGPGWVQVDLEESASIHAIVLWHYHASVVIFNDVIVQISDNADFTQNVRTLFNNDHDNSAGMGKGSDTAYISSGWGEIVDARDENLQPATARYIRLYTNKSTDGLSPRYVELAVYGKFTPAK
jgi:hypothetical protein